MLATAGVGLILRIKVQLSKHSKFITMKKSILIASIAVLSMTSATAFAGGKEKSKKEKCKTECTKPSDCTKPCTPTPTCCPGCKKPAS